MPGGSMPGGPGGMMPGGPMPGQYPPGGPGSPYANRPHPATTPVQPLPAPPYLASGTPARMGAPAEPWIDTLKTVMLVYGITLIACFMLPRSLSPEMVFSWTVIKNADSTGKLIPLLIGGTGLLAVILSLLPLTVSARGVAAAFLGIVPFGIQTFLVPEDIGWQGMVVFLGFLCLIPGLLLRSEYHGALVGRIMVTIGVLCVLLPLLVPQGGQILLVTTFKTIGTAAGKAKLLPILDVVWIVLTVLALLAWLPPPGSAGTKILAWIFIVKPLFDVLARTLLSMELGQLPALFKSDLFTLLFMPVALIAWNALEGYGVASVAGKSLEHSEG